ncbi:helix-turn-helix domain-containing protein [Roseiconus lacunae]|uniref:Helix-turn-helix transcriptional regulator n=1 Tax=Roseiconus lacunae TaxID=2605694 RepID=A0ABT7PF68_9BACT|nr:helix-turn-helix transcriptional regulator [Roseiconus lacunae]MDM4015140.1 helix-turn-helix transcriptional regulator [Roseiconus lacunae]
MEKNLYTERQNALLSLLRSTREQAGLRQEDVAERLGRPQSFVSKYESGERRLDILELYDVCEALGTSMAGFVESLEKKLKTKRRK